MNVAEIVMLSGVVFGSGFGAGYYLREKISKKRRERTLFVGNFE